MIKAMRALGGMFRKSTGAMPFTPRDVTPLIGPNGAIDGLGETSALSLSAVWGCVNLLAGTISTLPLSVIQKVDGYRPTVVDHPLNYLLTVSPNFDQTPVDLLEFVQASLEFWGNAYCRIVRGVGGIAALVPIRPDRMTVKRLSDGKIEYRWTDQGKTFRATDVEIWHVRGPGGDPLGGWSTLRYASETLGLARATNRAARKTFDNGLRPAGALTFKEWLTAEQRDVAQKKLVSDYMGAENAGRPMVLEGGVDYKPFSINPEDAQMLESRVFSAEEIARFFQVPPHMIGLSGAGVTWGKGLEQQTLAFQKFTLRRRVSRIEQAATKQLLTAAEVAAGMRVAFDFDSLLQGDSAARSKFYGEMTRIGAMTINEVRARENLAPVAGGDVPRMQIQNQPINEGEGENT